MPVVVHGKTYYRTTEVNQVVEKLCESEQRRHALIHSLKDARIVTPHGELISINTLRPGIFDDEQKDMDELNIPYVADLSTENEESQQLRELPTYVMIDIQSQSDDSVKYRFETNDEDADGVPDGKRVVHHGKCGCLSKALQLFGRSKLIIYGKRISVRVDGQRV